jgi:hypothetical protein
MSVTPLIAVQTLGILYELRYRRSQKIADELEAQQLKELLSD